MQNLNTLLTLLTEKKNLHISITDITGILNNDTLKIEPKFQIHSKKFCDTAKMTVSGYNTCMHCKKVCNMLAVKRKKAFSGLCAFGLFEIVYPVIIGNEVTCIIYIGNIIKDKEASLKKLKASATEDCTSEFSGLFTEAEYCRDTDKYTVYCEVIAEYIKLLYSKVNEIKKASYHPAVQSALRYININFYHPLTLKSIADLCFLNEKYLGRIFKEQLGESFHEYLNDVRLSNAKKLLHDEKNNILDAALSSGFNSPSYFTRSFKNKYGISPREYKSKKQ